MWFELLYKYPPKPSSVSRFCFLRKYNNMTRICYLLMSIAILVVGSGHETPQQVVTRYNNYKAICNGMGFEKVNCKDPKIDTIAFQSTITKHLVNLKAKETVIFDKVSLNEGNAFDKTSGVFTAPSDGIYSFTWTTLTSAGKTFITEIVRNGEMITRNFSDGRGRDGFAMSTSHANIKMKKGDKVWIRAHGTWAQYADGRRWCFFSGVKM